MVPGRLLLALLLLLAVAVPAAAQDPFLPKSEQSAGDMLQNLLLGKLKDKQAAPPASSSSSTTSSSTERLPRKAAGSSKTSKGTSDGAPPDAQAAKPARPNRLPPRRQAEIQPLPRLQPARPISASPTIQLPQPIPMPPIQ